MRLTCKVLATTNGLYLPTVMSGRALRALGRQASTLHAEIIRNNFDDYLSLIPRSGVGAFQYYAIWHWIGVKLHCSLGGSSKVPSWRAVRDSNPLQYERYLRIQYHSATRRPILRPLYVDDRGAGKESNGFRRGTASGETAFLEKRLRGETAFQEKRLRGETAFREKRLSEELHRALSVPAPAAIRPLDRPAAEL